MTPKISTADRLKILAEAKAGATSAALAQRYPYPQVRIARLISAGTSGHGRKLSTEDEDAMLVASQGGMSGVAIAERFGVHRNSVLRALERATARALGIAKPSRKPVALTPEQVDEAEKLHASGTPVSDLAERYGTSVATVTKALARRQRDKALRATIEGRPTRPQAKPQTETGSIGLTGDLAKQVVARREAMRTENVPPMEVIPTLAQLFGVPMGVIKQTLIDARKAARAADDFSHLA